MKAILRMLAGAVVSMPSTAWAQRLPEDWLPQDAGTQVQSFIPSDDALADVQVDSRLLTCVDQLDDPSFEVRESATQQLRDAARNKLELYALLSAGDLSPEQRYRLLNVVREQLQQRGAVGISVDQRRIPGGEILIEGFIEGLPAERALQIGDQITHLNGRALPSWEEFRNVVQSMRPGDKITVTVRRPLRGNDGRIQVDVQDRPQVEVMDVELELGSAEKLRDPRTGRRDLGVIDIERRREIREAVQRFGPEVNRVPVRGGMDALVALRPTRLDHLLDGDDRDPEIESYPDIMLIREQRRLIQEGLLEDSPQLRMEWQLRLRYILVRADQPGQSRELLLRVAERFAELMSH